MTYLSSSRQVYAFEHTKLPQNLLSKQSGFSLLELLISLLIFAIGFLGVASLQHVSLKITHDSVLQNTAITLTNTLIEKLRVTNGLANLAKWQERVKNELPQGKANLVMQGDHYQLTLQWQESEHSEERSYLQKYDVSFKLHP